MEITIVLGVAGFALLLLAYVMALFGRLKQDSWTFDILNIVGAILLAYYTYKENAIIFSVLLLAWAFVAVLNMIKLVMKK